MTGYNIWRTAPSERFSGGGLGGVRPLPMSAEMWSFWKLRRDRAIALTRTGAGGPDGPEPASGLSQRRSSPIAGEAA